jgi:hypothetical protein
MELAIATNQEASVELLRPTLAFIPQVICLQVSFVFFRRKK